MKKQNEVMEILKNHTEFRNKMEKDERSSLLSKTNNQAVDRQVKPDDNHTKPTQ